MEPQFVKVPDALQLSFLIRDMIVPYFKNPYHFHPELELTYIIKGAGMRYIGDNIEPFSAGDLVLVGSNLPHLWKNDKAYYEGNPSLNARAIVIQFKEDFLGPQLFEVPEMRKIKKILYEAKRGIEIRNQSRKKIARLMEDMIEQSETQKIISLLEILYCLSESDETQYLSGYTFDNSSNLSEIERINTVFAYIFENFSDPITLNDVAALVHLSPTSFCRYFKTHTNKSFSTFLIETRIHHACKLIMNAPCSVAEVAFQSGFDSPSYFIKQFKRVTGITPLEYKNKLIRGTFQNS